MTILVTGATGLVGNNLLRQLATEGARVRVLVPPEADLRPLEGFDVEQVTGDVRDRAAVERACRGVELVLHAAARVHLGWRDLQWQRAVNVEGTRHVAEAARSVGARMVHISSVDALSAAMNRQQPIDEQAPLHPKVPCSYVLTKRESEQVFLEAVARGLDGVLVNPGYLLGPWDWRPSSGRMLLLIAAGRMRIAPRGGASFCDVRDVVNGILTAARRGRRGERYILAGHNLTFVEAWTLMAQILQAPPPFRRPSRFATMLAGRLGDLWARCGGTEPAINSASMAMGQLQHYYCSRRAVAELGYGIRPLDETVRDAWQWFRTHGYC